MKQTSTGRHALSVRRSVALGTSVLMLAAAVLLALISVAGPSSADPNSSPTPNLLTNGSFEGAGASPGPTVGWALSNANSAAYQGPAEDGNYFADFVPTVNNGNIFQDVAVSAGAANYFYASVWLKAGVGNPTATVAIWGNLNGTGHGATTVTLTPNWRKVTVGMYLTGTTTTVRLQIYGLTNTHINMDNASLVFQLLSNGSFESAGVSPGPTPAWGTYNANRAAWAGGAEDGTYLADIVATGPAGSIFHDVGVGGGIGQIYQGSIWYRSSAPATLALWGNLNGTGSASVSLPVSSSWRQAVVSMALRGPTSTIRLQVYGTLNSHLNLDNALLTVSSPPAQTTPAPISTSRYPRDLTGGPSDVTLMRSRGAVDASNNPSGHAYVQLLDIGGQSDSGGQFGVLLSATSNYLSYAQLVAALKGYIDGYASRLLAGAPAVIAVGTNNDVDVSATDGRVWAIQVIAPLAAYAAQYPGLSVAGANDIEPGFSAGVGASRDWLSGYLGGTTARFYFNGSADGCSWTSVNGGCNNGWRASDMYWLSGGASPSRVLTLPQIYNSTMAEQWKYISLTGVVNGQPRVNFAGPLTEYTACDQAGGSCFSLGGYSAWLALWNQISSDVRTAQPSMPYSTDLRIN